jgi:hypothetical protein
MVEVEMGDNQGVNRVFRKTQCPEAIADCIPARLPIRSTVEQEQTVARLDHISVDDWR